MFSSGTALGSESSGPAGIAFCILGFSVTVRVHHRTLTATHECCFVREGHPHRLRRGGGGASTKDLVRVWSSLIFAEEMYRAFRVIEQRAHCKM